jgi:hypothetical protein
MEPPSPAASVKRLSQAQMVPRDKAMPDQAYLQLLDYCKYDKRAFALVLFLGDTGCRIGGCAGLRWADIQFAEEIAIVQEKGAPERFVFFGHECSIALLRWQQEQRLKRQGEFVFSRNGKRMNNDSLGQYFEKVCQRAGIGQWGPHSLRHRKGHQMADSKVAPTVAQTVLGHTDVNTTLKHYYPKDLTRAQEVVKDLAFKRLHMAPIQPFPLEGIHDTKKDKSEGCCSGRQNFDFAGGSKDKNLVKLKVGFQTVEEFTRTIEVLEPFDPLAQPIELLFHVNIFGLFPAFVSPMSCNTVFRGAMHFFRAYLNFDQVSRGTDDRGMERAI